MLGVLDDVRQAGADRLHRRGAAGRCCSARRGAEFGGSEWAHVAHGHLGGLPPQADLEAEQALAPVLVEAAARGLLEGSHDLSDGGLAMALAEACLARGVGARSASPTATRSSTLFSESAARALVAVPPESFDALAGLCSEHEVPCYRARRHTGGTALVVEGVLQVPVEELRDDPHGHAARAVRLSGRHAPGDHPPTDRPAPSSHDAFSASPLRLHRIPGDKRFRGLTQGPGPV